MGSTRLRLPQAPATRPLVGVVSLVLVTAVTAPIAGCGSGSGSGDQTSVAASADSGVKAVTIEDYTFKPASIAVPKGTTVTFTNQDSTAHTATSKESGVFESDSIEPGKSAEVRLEKSGTFAYYCLFHPFMKGTIAVE